MRIIDKFGSANCKWIKIWINKTHLFFSFISTWNDEKNYGNTRTGNKWRWNFDKFTTIQQKWINKSGIFCFIIYTCKHFAPEIFSMKVDTAHVRWSDGYYGRVKQILKTICKLSTDLKGHFLTFETRRLAFITLTPSHSAVVLKTLIHYSI